MKRIITLGLIGIAAHLACAADSTSPEKVTQAAKQVAEKTNYSWATSTKEGDGGSGRLGTIEGRAEKSGVTFLGFSVGGIPVEVCMKGGKGSAKALEGWQTFDEIAQTSGTAAAVVRFLRSYKAPVAESVDLAAKTKALKEEEGVFSGDLKEDAVKELLLFGTRRGDDQEAPKTSDAKGSIKFWIKDGALTKYEIKVQGKVTSGDRESDINRTTTVELKEVGTTKMDVPAEAVQKLS